MCDGIGGIDKSVDYWSSKPFVFGLDSARLEQRDLGVMRSATEFLIQEKKLERNGFSASSGCLRYNWDLGRGSIDAFVCDDKHYLILIKSYNGDSMFIRDIEEELGL